MARKPAQLPEMETIVEDPSQSAPEVSLQLTPSKRKSPGESEATEVGVKRIKIVFKRPEIALKRIMLHLSTKGRESRRSAASDSYDTDSPWLTSLPESASDASVEYRSNILACYAEHNYAPELEEKAEFLESRKGFKSSEAWTKISLNGKISTLLRIGQSHMNVVHRDLAQALRLIQAVEAHHIICRQGLQDPDETTNNEKIDLRIRWSKLHIDCASQYLCNAQKFLCIVAKAQRSLRASTSISSWTTNRKCPKREMWFWLGELDDVLYEVECVVQRFIAIGGSVYGDVDVQEIKGILQRQTRDDYKGHAKLRDFVDAANVDEIDRGTLVRVDEEAEDNVDESDCTTDAESESSKHTIRTTSEPLCESSPDSKKATYSILNPATAVRIEPNSQLKYLPSISKDADEIRNMIRELLELGSTTTDDNSWDGARYGQRRHRRRICDEYAACNW